MYIKTECNRNESVIFAIELTLLAHLKTSQLGYLLVPVLSKVVSVDRPTIVLPTYADDRTDQAMLEFLQSVVTTKNDINFIQIHGHHCPHSTLTLASFSYDLNVFPNLKSAAIRIFSKTVKSV